MNAPAPQKSGNLSEVPFARIYYKLAQSGATGRLTIYKEQESKHLYLVYGAPAQVYSNRQSERLGEFLVAQQRITRESLVEAIALHQAGGDRFGRTLVEMGLITEGELNQALKLQSKYRLLEMFNWFDGYYAYYNGERHQGEAEGALAEEPPLKFLWQGILQYSAPRQMRVFFGPRQDWTMAIKRDIRDHLAQFSLSPQMIKFLDSLGFAPVPLREALLRTLPMNEQRAGQTGDHALRLLFYLAATDGITFSGAEGGLRDPQRPLSMGSPPEAGGTPGGEPEKADAEVNRLLSALRDLEDKKSDFDILGVGEEATLSDVRAKFMEASRLYHPTLARSSGSETQKLRAVVFERVEQAFRRLEQALTAAGDETAGSETRAAKIQAAAAHAEKLLDAGKWADVISDLSRKVKYFNDAGILYFHYAWAVYLQGLPTRAKARQQAVTLIQTGLMYDRSSPWAVYYMGRFKEDEGDTAKAVEYYSRCQMIAPNFRDVPKRLQTISVKGKARTAGGLFNKPTR